MQRDVTESKLRDNMAVFYREDNPEGTLGLVLGAGNAAAIVPLDILDRMINRGHVVICKMNPIHDHLGPIFEEIFEPLIDDGYLTIVYGGSEVGEFLTRHELVQAIHLTGSAKTHDMVVMVRARRERGARRQTIV
jgi:aldehyde dehydrogenase (NAD(P)+)